MGSSANLAMTLAALGWLALLLAPFHHRVSWIFARSCAIVIAIEWSVLILWHDQFLLLGSGLITRPTQSLEIAQTLSGIQFLAFNLFVGSWQVEDSVRQRFPHIFLVPFLVLTACFGPLGLVAHILTRDAVKWYWRRTDRLDTGGGM